MTARPKPSEKSDQEEDPLWINLLVYMIFFWVYIAKFISFGGRLRFSMRDEEQEYGNMRRRRYDVM